tara:strand:+ start:1003 stop:1110 length:108 start_codon:yes stop_codon:yes gene_type:complete
MSKRGNKKSILLFARGLKMENAFRNFEIFTEKIGF